MPNEKDKTIHQIAEQMDDEFPEVEFPMGEPSVDFPAEPSPEDVPGFGEPEAELEPEASEPISMDQEFLLELLKLVCTKSGCIEPDGEEESEESEESEVEPEESESEESESEESEEIEESEKPDEPVEESEEEESEPVEESEDADAVVESDIPPFLKDSEGEEEAAEADEAEADEAEELSDEEIEDADEAADDPTEDQIDCQEIVTQLADLAAGSTLTIDDIETVKAEIFGEVPEGPGPDEIGEPGPEGPEGEVEIEPEEAEAVEEVEEGPVEEEAQNEDVDNSMKAVEEISDQKAEPELGLLEAVQSLLKEEGIEAVLRESKNADGLEFLGDEESFAPISEAINESMNKKTPPGSMSKYSRCFPLRGGGRLFYVFKQPQSTSDIALSTDKALLFSGALSYLPFYHMLASLNRRHRVWGIYN